MQKTEQDLIDEHYTSIEPNLLQQGQKHASNLTQAETEPRIAKRPQDNTDAFGSTSSGDADYAEQTTSLATQQMAKAKGKASHSNYHSHWKANC